MINYNRHVAILALVLILFSFNTVSGQEGIHHSEYFGAETVAGDFNGDGYTDLAVGSTSDWDLPVANGIEKQDVVASYSRRVSRYSIFK